MTEPAATTPEATGPEETSKSERRFAWIAIGIAAFALALAVVFAVFYGVWIPLVLIAIGDIWTVRTVVKAFRNAKRLEAEGR